jgi:hypothetical protein
LLRLQTARSMQLTSRSDHAIKKTGPCTFRAVPTTPRMLELIAESLNYN